MLRPHHVILLATLLVDGGTAVPPHDSSGPDAGMGHTPASPSSRDAGMGVSSTNPSGALANTSTGDAGPVAHTLPMVDGRWPDDMQLLTTLDGRAVMAAHSAIQAWAAEMVKEDPRYAGTCEVSPKALDVTVQQSRGVYVIQIDRRVDRCGWADPSFNKGLEPEIYVVSPEGRVLAHPLYPYYR